MNETRTVQRVGDMHPTRGLRVTTQRCGDVIVSISQDGLLIGDMDTGSPNDREASVEFCVSGGRSYRTLRVLRLLVRAMEKDNAERPIP